MRILTYTLLLISNLVCAQDAKTPISIMNPEAHYEIVGELGIQLGAVFTVEGVIVQGSPKGDESGPNLLIKKIKGFSNQKLIIMPIKTYWGEFGKASLPEIITGNTYRFSVYETGGYVGTPSGAYKETKIAPQTTGFYFRNELIVVSGEIIEAMEMAAPSDFLNREALISGVAKNIKDEPHIVGQNWALQLTGAEKWKRDELGKQVEVYGLIKKTENQHTYYVEDAVPKLSKLEDMVNKKVTLRGQARSMNGQWWFHYRGRDVFVESMDQLRGWTANNHFRPMEISGILKSIEAKDLDKSQIKNHRYCDGDYIIVNASWQAISALLIPEVEVPKGNK